MTDPCEMCGGDVPENLFLLLGHIALDLVMAMVVFFRIFVWHFSEGYRSKIKDWPCTCGHSAFWHMTPPTMGPNGVFPVRDKSGDCLRWRTMWVEFHRDRSRDLDECLHCEFWGPCNIGEVSGNRRCGGYTPIDNLTFIENFYGKTKARKVRKRS